MSFYTKKLQSYSKMYLYKFNDVDGYILSIECHFKLSQSNNGKNKICSKEKTCHQDNLYY